MRARSLCLAALIASLGAVSHPLRAQASTLAVGARVRVTAPTALARHRQEGNVLALRGDSLLLQLQAGGDSVALPMAKVERLEVSQGLHSSTLKGLGFGVVTGAVLGTVGGASSGGSYPAIAAVGGGIIGGLAGLVIGGVIGAFHTSERWERIPVRSAGRLSVAPTQGNGVVLSLGVRF